MPSAIDATKPEEGEATTQSVRDNFANAKSEIESLMPDGGVYVPIDMSGADLVFDFADTQYRYISGVYYWQCAIGFPITADANPIRIELFGASIPGGSINDQGCISFSNEPSARYCTVIGGSNQISLCDADGEELTNADMSGKQFNAFGFCFL